MKIPLTTSLAGLLLIFTTLKPVLAQDNKPVIKSMSLKEAQEYAVKNNANSRNSAIDMELAKKKIIE